MAVPLSHLLTDWRVTPSRSASCSWLMPDLRRRSVSFSENVHLGCPGVGCERGGGVYTGGVAAIAAKIAVAVSAVAPTAVGEFASGSHVLLWGDGLTAPEVRSFLLEHHPDPVAAPAGPVCQPRRPYQVNICCPTHR